MKKVSWIDLEVKKEQKRLVKTTKHSNLTNAKISRVIQDGASSKGIRKPTVNPTEQRKRFLALASQLRNDVNLTEAQRLYLADAFEQIGNGEVSADEALRLKRRKGQKEANDVSRQKISIVFAQVASKMSPVDGPLQGEGMSLIQALESVAPFARQLFGAENSEKYSVEYLQKLWSDPSYAHMRTPFRTPFDPDSPFPIIQLKTTSNGTI